MPISGCAPVLEGARDTDHKHTKTTTTRQRKPRRDQRVIHVDDKFDNETEGERNQMERGGGREREIEGL